ncbi:purine nucleosidase [Quadrisphaera granulorum]|uniref:Purine nucleosidase n=1 Tax=Quadrisphaera granulorum TaxID=317664 RepID=A0A316AEL0_9ACTN|nr:nucleoside hydrolase [Quadrisphaera granulorum]PWJ55420.1 purine nucleosidase [Quadrisphaera granulorum]SZE95484.1 purine nucleosidase [Quadrisphaera granulorum]
MSSTAPAADRRRVVLDTDLGTDVDDALTLALLLGSPEVELVGITTVYGDTDLRARATSRLLELAGVPGPGVPGGIPVRAGAPTPLSGAEVWWAGHEGSLLGDLRTATTTPPAPGTSAADDAADWLAATAAAAPGEVDLLAIGPLTGVATALRRHPELAGHLRSLVLMGGRWDGARTTDGLLEDEHNLRSDAVAAAEVLTCGAPTVVVGLEITRQVRLEAADVERIAAAGPLGAVLAAQVRQWWEFWDEPWGIPHDPVTALLLVEPGVLELGPPGRVDVDERGAVVHVPDDRGAVRVAVGVDAERAAAAVVRRVLAGCTASRP